MEQNRSKVEGFLEQIDETKLSEPRKELVEFLKRVYCIDGEARKGERMRRGVRYLDNAQ